MLIIAVLATNLWFVALIDGRCSVTTVMLGTTQTVPGARTI